MKLLIVTQKVNKDDPILGFFHRWIIEFAKHCESVVVICLEKGVYDLPANVKVLSLGKEDGVSRSRYLRRFYSYIWKERMGYDAVFVHMNPIYVILGGFLWKIFGKKVSLWYTHKNVDWKLRVAEKLVHKIFTASKESFRLVSKKVQVMGHGIDVDVFAPSPDKNRQNNQIVSVGRISSTKNQLAIIKGFETLKSLGYSGNLNIVGGPITADDIKYDEDLKEYVRSSNLQDFVNFKGPVSPDDVVDMYKQADVFINLSSTGSMDKAVLEAMACNLKVITSNDAFKNILPPENLTDSMPQDIANKINILSKRPVDSHWREYVISNHSLNSLISHLSKDLIYSQ